MKATGVVRRIDDLGRVVIPKEIRKTLRIKEGEPLEIFTDREGQVILKKYSPIGELSEFATGYAETLAKNLPYGQQRRLEIVRALATEPKILFLDEPAAGMNPQETAELTQLIRRIKEEFDITIMLIEHDMSLVMEVTERIYVLEYGRLIAHGTPDEIKTNQRVIEAYLGGEG